MTTRPVASNSSAERDAARFSTRRVGPTWSMIPSRISTAPSAMIPNSWSASPRRTPFAPRKVSSCLAPRIRIGRDTVSRRSPALLVNAIDRETGKQLRVEIRGFLGHHAAAEGDVGYLLDRGRLQKKCDLSRSLARSVARRFNPTDVMKIALLPDCLFADAQDASEESLMQHPHVELPRSTLKFERKETIAHRRADYRRTRALPPDGVQLGNTRDRTDAELGSRTFQKSIKRKPREAAHQAVGG